MKKLHIGCGPIYLDGWINVDINPLHETDVYGDILEMNFENLDVVYSCHAAEHFLYPDGIVKLLSLCYKWMKTGGIIRIAVPDLELAARAYVNGDDLTFLYSKDFKGYYYKDRPCERFNFFVKAWNHQMCYDFNLLRELFADAGFIHIQKKKANDSLIPSFNHDRFISESLYIEAVK